MTREDAIINAEMVMNYLATYQKRAYLTHDITPHEVRIHYFDMYATEEEVERVAKKMEALILIGTEITFDRNEQIGQTTFDIRWDLWK